jgi:ATP phosphoribosyltransferase
MEAYLRARPFLSLTANVQGGTPESVAHQVNAEGEIAGLQGPTIARVYPKTMEDDNDWFAVTIIVPEPRLLDAMDALRRAGAADITAIRLSYVFESCARSFEALRHRVETDD